MGNRARHPKIQAQRQARKQTEAQPQTQPQRQPKYSRFASTGTLRPALLVAGLLALLPSFAMAEEGSSILSNDPQALNAEPAPAPQAEPADESSAETAPSAQAPAAATTDPELNSKVPLRYVVKKGDTLWDIANHFLKQPWKWPELWYGNPNIKNPHLIYPGDVLYLTYVDGKPRLSRAAPATPAGVEKLSPQVREEALAEPIPTIPGDAIRAFLRGSRVVGASELDEAPYIVDFTEAHLIGGAGIPAYAKGLAAGAPRNHSIMRKGGVYRDPETREVLGYEAAYIGSASVTTPGDPARIHLDSTVREVLAGDRLLEQDESALMDANFYPHAPEANIEGHIIAVTDGVSQISRYQIVTLSRGARDGVEVGQVYTIYQAGREVRDPYGSGGNPVVRLPEEQAGLLMVFKTYERVSYALVMKSIRSIHLLDKFRKPDN